MRNEKINIKELEAILTSQGRKKMWLAEQLGVSPSTLRRALTRKAGPKTLIIAIAKVLGVSEEEIAA